MKRKWKAPGINVLLLLMVMALVAAALAVSAAMSIGQYRAATVQNARTTGAQVVSQVAGTVGRYVTEMGQTMDLLAGTMEQSRGERDDFLTAFLQVRPDVVAVTSYDGAGALQECWSLEHAPKETILCNLSFDAALLEDGRAEALTAPHVETIFAGWYPWVVTRIERVEGPGAVRYLALDLSFSSIAATISNVGIGQHGYCFLMDTAGNIVYHPQQQLIYAGLKSEDTVRLAAMADGTWEEGDVIYSLQTVADGPWRVVGISYVDELVNENVSRQVGSLVGIALLVLAAVLVVGGVLSHVLTRPLHRLARAMEDFERDADHFTYCAVGGTREVSELSDSFGHMVVRIQRLMATVREEELNLRKTELKALQAQINPHFLYNTLDSIAWMCERGKNADAVQMVHALARLFRISISKGHELIPIAKEIEHAESYLQIQKYRYKNQFTYHFEVDPACTGYLCNKITLQPIIENAITHGLELMVDEGHIEVTVRQEGQDILFTVSDNGVGMESEQVEAILHQEPSDRTGIGIKNVNDRLRIYFGESYGLHIDSVPDEGTTVTVRMPKVEEGSHETK